MPTTPAIHKFITEIERILEHDIPASECDYLDEFCEAAMPDIKYWDEHGYHTIYDEERENEKKRMKEAGEAGEKVKEGDQTDDAVPPRNRRPRSHICNRQNRSIQ
jgi:hypothetical protein